MRFVGQSGELPSASSNTGCGLPGWENCQGVLNSSKNSRTTSCSSAFAATPIISDRLQELGGAGHQAPALVAPSVRQVDLLAALDDVRDLRRMAEDVGHGAREGL